MYKVLLVDDERMILEGISQVVDWGKAGTQLVGTARNGIEAYDQIQASPPDFVISDISMPGLDGIGLVAKTTEHFPDVRFILLSGYKDFDYACRAMQYGVKHYLLKPCNERQIHEALTELGQEREEQEERKQFVNRMKLDFQRMLPHVKEHFLKEFISYKTYGSRDIAFYERLFGLELQDKQVRMLLLRVEESHEPEHLFALQNIAGDLMDHVLLSTTMQGQLLIVLESADDTSGFMKQIEAVRTTFHRFYKLEVTVAVSESDSMQHSRGMYRETLHCMNHRFYTGEGSLITKEDLAADDTREMADLELDEEKFGLLIKAGNREEVAQEVDRLFGILSRMKLEISVTRSYVLQLYAAMIRICPEEERAAFTSRMVVLAEQKTLACLKFFVQEAAERMTAIYYKSNVYRQSSTVDKMITIIEQNYRKSDLSLNGVAGQMLYMNSDYLGKIFKKVTGENFSHYVNRYRIERAAEHIRETGDVKVFELAEWFGFGGNAQYFSQVFKKWAGMTPSEYIKSHERG
ncbi:response regulator transcription factor [Paenibacillus polymyxa]|uniref:response regulator transcription factor n=1 Tax=Paenibacillus polymyxa TaxID=1406 RepID=UPI00129AC7C2|nr:response regulator [Paenibacillus polymyxa]KAE8561500.1 DNA-binding response regulator [Paenibacillus polymyxa]MCJ1222908.1 response regulator [Paenibacillus polymyxa]